MRQTGLIVLMSGLMGIGIGYGAVQWVKSEENTPTETEAITEESTSEITSEETASSDSYPLYLATMTHMEGNFLDDKDEGVFDLHVEELRFGMDLADEYDAKLTIESEKPFARANTLWGHNMMQEILNRGHGVGTHCDIGFRDEIESFDDYVKALKENKELVDSLVGEENNKGCSGAGGENDWVVGATEAGFGYINGIVAMHTLAMPLENRPDPDWTDEFIYSKAFHDHAPVELVDRIHLVRLADANDFEEDMDGTLVMSAGSLGRLDLMEEEQSGETCKNCEFTTKDVDLMIESIRDAAEVHDGSRVGKVDAYFPVNIFEPENETMLRYFFEEVQTLVDEGLVQWATQLQIYEAFLDWETENR